MRDEPAFQAELGRRYTAFEDALDAAEGADDTRQLWHTPTELFAPHYGEAVARYLVANYRLTTYPYDDLVVYELGAGRGTLMLNVLDYLRREDPQVYARTRYSVVEISPALARLQAARLRASGHGARAAVVAGSVLDWRRRVPEPCFLLALEVLDNLAHDGIRYDAASGEPLQAHVLVDAAGDLYELYARPLDPLAARFFRVRHAATAGRYPRPLGDGRLARWLAARLPLAANLSAPEYVPTRLMQLFDVLERYFPAHRLVAADFHSLPHAVDGLNAPVVQTRYRRTTVPVSTPLVCRLPSFPCPFLVPRHSPPLRLTLTRDPLPQVHQGYFDILFPTDFRVTEAIYRAITGKLTRVMSHGDFMRCWANIEDTETRSGENPLLSHYQNASVMVTV